MKRWIMAAVLVCMAGTAMANWNLRQQADGGTVWINGQSVTVPVGGGIITVELDDVSTASTAYIVTHRPGLIKKAYLVIHSAITSASPSITVFLQSTSDKTQYTQVSNPSGAAVQPSDAPAGSSGSVTFTNTNTVSQGQVIAVVTDGGSTNTSRGTITLVIE
jgi:hypothetical protein